MNEIPRHLPLWAFAELGMSDPMAFISGPRQCGKTYIARKQSSHYFNWDTPEVRNAFLKDPYFFRSGGDVIVFDEIHKRRDWKKIIKGYYDSPTRQENFIVTGSGRFDQFQKKGDSLQGRYFSYQLFPFSRDEISGHTTKLSKPRDFKTWTPQAQTKNSDLDTLLTLGGFPAPFLKGKDQWLRRWEDQYIQRLVREDSRDFSGVELIDKLDMLVRLLPDRVASPISIKALSEDIDVSPVAVKSWMRLLEVLFLGQRVAPYHYKIHRAVKKEQKWYFFQWSMVKDPGARLENFIAVQLMTALSAWSEQGYGRWELFYLRDQDRREVDFVICKDLVPQALVEVKSNASKLSTSDWPSSLEHYANRLKIPAFLLSPHVSHRKVGPQKWILSIDSFLQGLISQS